ncbi:asparagine synthase-related protein [Mesorhizobium sp.]|uniref:asparagine synthase-related protein n=1 Tax=Mesorhizobium sp. TaxID=1871066 RepID=UPI0025F0B7B5|nr:asparagine synthase-related protein [Mesorhizobium sp.]
MVADVEVGSFLSGGLDSSITASHGGWVCRGCGIAVVKGSAARASPDRQRVNRAACRNFNRGQRSSAWREVIESGMRCHQPSAALPFWRAAKTPFPAVDQSRSPLTT